MIYNSIKLGIYIVCIGMSMYALSCFNYDVIIRKNKVREFHAFYFITSIVLGYLFASFILEFITIRF